MRIFRKFFMTKKEMRAKILDLKVELQDLKDAYHHLKYMFPFELGDVVYDIQLRDNKGRYTKDNPSIEYSRINPVIVDENNYFSLVERYKKSDVFTARDAAEVYLKVICEATKEDE